MSYDIMQKIVAESNKYAKQNGTDLALNVEELKSFIGLLIIMCFHSLLSMRRYWSTDPNFSVPRITKVWVIADAKTGNMLKFSVYECKSTGSVDDTLGARVVSDLWENRVRTLRWVVRFSVTCVGLVAVYASLFIFRASSCTSAFLFFLFWDYLLTLWSCRGDCFISGYKMMKHVQLSPYRSRADTVSLSSTVSYGSLSPEPLGSRSSSYSSLNESLQVSLYIYNLHQVSEPIPTIQMGNVGKTLCINNYFDGF
ncbi:hypothetical protein JTB14_009074 [Gonioctena quinquepunctata]|nr:hypothetical protein JTB14_009074 [Gonioctena quinquepunctata]